jgi:hypothetical protein
MKRDPWLIAATLAYVVGWPLWVGYLVWVAK